MQSSSTIDSIQSALTGGVSGGTQQSQQLLDSFMPLLQVFIVGSSLLSIVFVVYLIINIVQKQRDHRAILRMDKNLQLLVDRHVHQDKPAPNSEPQANEQQ